MNNRDPYRFHVRRAEPSAFFRFPTKKLALKKAIEIGGDCTVEDWGQTEPNKVNKWLVNDGKIIAAGRSKVP